MARFPFVHYLQGDVIHLIDEQSLILYIPNDAKFTLVLAKEPTLAQRARSCHCGYKAIEVFDFEIH